MPPRKAMVLAAGLGTRLRPFTEYVPKPAVPFCGIPALRWNLAMLAAAGVKQVVVNTHWCPEEIRKAVGNPEDFGLEVLYSHEDSILGTGGGIVKVADFFRNESFYIVNGKILFDADLQSAYNFHSNSGSLATMVVRPYTFGENYGAVQAQSNGLIRAFISAEEISNNYRTIKDQDNASFSGMELPEICRDCKDEKKKNGIAEEEKRRAFSRLNKGLFLFTGVHLLDPVIFRYLPDAGESCIKTDGYIKMIEDNLPVYAFVNNKGYWSDPSTPERYLQTVLDLNAGLVSLDRFLSAGLDPYSGFLEPEPNVRIHPDAHIVQGSRLYPPCWIGPGAYVEKDAVVGPHAVIERGARIGRGAKIVRSMVWRDTDINPGKKLYREIGYSG